MTPTLYFLRSSEQYVLNKMLPYAYRLDELNKTVEDYPALSIYKDFYGFTRKDLGIYALVDNEIAGAVWGRKLNHEHNSQAFVNENSLVLSMAVLPKFRGIGVGSHMMEQFLREAAELYEQISVSVLSNSRAVKFYKKFGFWHVENHTNKSVIDGSTVNTMVKKLEKKEIKRPSDGYNPQKWMD